MYHQKISRSVRTTYKPLPCRKAFRMTRKIKTGLDQSIKLDPTQSYFKI